MAQLPSAIAGWLQPSASSLLGYLEIVATSPLLRPASILSAFEDDFSFAQEDDWDGRGAVQLSDAVIRLSEDLIREFGSISHLVEVTPGRDGSLSFIWNDHRGNYVYLDVGPMRNVHLFYEVVGYPKWEGVSVASDPKLRGALSKAFGFLRPPQMQRIVIARTSGRSQYEFSAAA